jgi:hypothetical protein
MLQDTLPPNISRLVDEAYAAFEIGDQARAQKLARDVHFLISAAGISPVEFWIRFKEASEVIATSDK